MKKDFHVARLGLLLLTTGVLGVAGNLALADGKTMPPPFLLGATWEDTMSPGAKQLFLECGCNFVRLQGSGFSWSQALHAKELDELRGHGVYTMLQMGSHWPDGSFFSHKEDYFIDDKGETGVVDNNANAVGYSGSFWPQYSYASAGFRERLEASFSTYLKALGADPSIVEVQIHNEPGYHWVPGRVFDYNPQAISAFQQWLPSQYSDIAALNASWGSDYASFADVQPYKERPPVSHIAAWMDWRRFNVDLITKFLTWEENYVRQFCPTARFMTNMAGPLDNWYPLRLGDNYRFTAPFDNAGIDIYATQWSNRYFVGYAMDTTRGAAGDRPITVAECDVYDPTKYLSFTADELADRLRSDIYRYVGHGATSILLWTWGSPGADMLTAGDFNSRVAAVREIAHTAKMLNLGDFTSPRRNVALVVNLDSFLYYGGIGPNLDGGDRCKNSLEGLYAALCEAGYQVDIVSSDQLRGGVDPQYRALVLATPAVTDDRLTASLKAFVDRGGVVAAEAPFAQFDRWGKQIPAGKNALTSLFGVTTVTPYDDSNDQAIPGLGFEGKGRTVIALAGAKALSTFADGSPAVTEMAEGRGHAILIASDAGVVDSDDSQPGLTRFLSTAFDRDAGLKPVVRAVGDRFLDTSLLQDKSGNQLVIVNTTCAKLDAPVASHDVDVQLRGVASAPNSKLYMIGPPRVSDGRTFAGPRPAPLPALSNGISHIVIPTVDSATLVLIARNHSPLLATDAPATALAGSTVQVNVVCYNPSNKTARGTLSIESTGPEPVSGPEQSVTIPARGETHCTIGLATGHTPGRSAFAALLKFGGGTQSIESVPIDIMLGASSDTVSYKRLRRKPLNISQVPKHNVFVKIYD
jgi:beta-galactosidase GanA